MSRDHFVPQQMIKRFANANGQLAELHKPSMSLATKLKRPKGILFKDDYYKDAAGDLDAEALKGIEQKFARHYDQLVSSNQQLVRGEPAQALIDWLASMLSRTPLIHSLSLAVAAKHSPEMVPLLHAFRNEQRRQWFEMTRDLITRENWKWTRLTVRGEGVVVLTDNPVVLVKVPGSQAFSLLAPLTEKSLLIAGMPGAVEQLRKAKLQRLNLYLAAWAGERIFCSQRKVLEHLLEVLGSETAWAERARRPFCGFPENIRRMRSPEEGEVDRSWEQMLTASGALLIEKSRG